MFFAQVTTKSSSFGVSLDGWPDWLVVLVGTVVVALALWLLIKALKWALWVLLFLVLLGGLEWAGWLLMR
ncbi:MAG: hypothetical protein EXS32_15595 [Opitutus sp.]|nr:hypothetical protein [Opitutus sp.]